MSTEVQHRAPRVGTTYRPRLKGLQRTAVARELGQDYEAGATIRALAAERDMSFGTVRKLLLEDGVRLRGRGGRVSRKVTAGPRG